MHVQPMQGLKIPVTLAKIICYQTVSHVNRSFCSAILYRKTVKKAVRKRVKIS